MEDLEPVSRSMIFGLPTVAPLPYRTSALKVPMVVVKVAVDMALCFVGFICLWGQCVVVLLCPVCVGFE